MRPLKLTVSGFGPYAKEQVFDLEKLGNYGIYLITGDTGAGKTTIFDAINFALFGEASGKDRDGKMLRSKYAELSTETFVELEFLYRDKKYVIRRNPEYERLAKRGKNPTTKQAANATLILPDGKIIDKSEKNVNKKVEEILGITQKQFKQICMIAQGDFMKILLADTKERSQTFRKIFNTEKYESFEKKLDELNDKYKNQYNSLTDKLSNSKENISFDENEEFLEKFPDYENRIKTDFQEFLQEIIDFQKKKNDIYSRENDEIQAKKEKNLLALNEAQEVENKKLQLEQKNSEFEIVNKDVKIYKDLILLHPELQKSIKNNTDKISSIEKDLEIYEKISNLKKKISEENDSLEIKISEKIDLETQKNEQSLLLNKNKNDKETLKDSNIKLQEFIHEKNNLELKFKELATFKNYIFDYNSKNSELEKINETITTFDFDINSLRNEIASLEKNIENQNNQLLTFNDIQKNENKIEIEKINYNSRIQDINSYKNLYSEIKNLNVELENEQKKYTEISEKYAQKDSLAKKMRKNYNDNQAGILAQQLVEGEKCPVCGSTSHPHPAKILSEEDILNLDKDEIEKFENEALSLSNEVKSQSEICSGIKGKLEDRKKSFEKVLNNEKIEFENAENWIEEQSLFLENKLIEIENLIDKENNRKIEKETIEKEIQSLNKELKIKNEKLNSLDGDKKMLENQKIKLEENIKIISKSISENSNLVSDSQMKNEELNSTNYLKNWIDSIEKSVNTKEQNLSEQLDLVDRNIESEETNVNLFKKLEEEFPKIEEKLNEISSFIKENESEQVAIKTRLNILNKGLAEMNDSLSLEFKDETVSLTKINELKNNILKTENKINNEKEILNNLQIKLASLEGEISNLKLDIQNRSFKDKNELLEQQKEIDLELKEHKEKFDKNKFNLIANEKLLNEIGKQSKKLFEIRKKYDSIQALSATTKGTISGKDKITFETYIQMKYFERVIARANLRFMIMSNAQYELKREEEAKDAKSKSGLELEIIDHYNNTTRNVRTLSGGESFMASLSLALGFSDEIQSMSGGIQLDTMFIDEGFGTLDEDTLKTAIDALIKLSDENKLIGIISHVEELKNRIDKQIVVTKSTDGTSTANIIS